MAKTQKKIPYEQALNLSIYMRTFAELNAVIQGAQQRLERLRQPLQGYAEIAGIPLDRTGVNVKIDKGPDKKGMIGVEWEEADAP